MECGWRRRRNNRQNDEKEALIWISIAISNRFASRDEFQLECRRSTVALFTVCFVGNIMWLYLKPRNSKPWVLVLLLVVGGAVWFCSVLCSGMAGGGLWRWLRLGSLIAIVDAMARDGCVHQCGGGDSGPIDDNEEGGVMSTQRSISIYKAGVAHYSLKHWGSGQMRGIGRCCVSRGSQSDSMSNDTRCCMYEQSANRIRSQQGNRSSALGNAAKPLNFYLSLFSPPFLSISLSLSLSARTITRAGCQH